MKLKPKAYSISPSGYEIVYKCGMNNCDFKFTLANNNWHFCPQCGTAINWGVVTRANEEWRQEFMSVFYNDKERQKLLSELDELNKNILDEDRREFPTTEATLKANRKLNAQYYLGIGWTKEKLIEELGFVEEDFE